MARGNAQRIVIGGRAADLLDTEAGGIAYVDSLVILQQVHGEQMEASQHVSYAVQFHFQLS
jgi:hypothetical protein